MDSKNLKQLQDLKIENAKVEKISEVGSYNERSHCDTDARDPSVANSLKNSVDV